MNGKNKGNLFVVSVLNHKTGLKGAAKITLDKLMSRKDRYIQFIRPEIRPAPGLDDTLFLTLESLKTNFYILLSFWKGI